MNAVDRLSWIAMAAISGVGTRTILNIHNYLIKHDIGWDDFWVLPVSASHKINLSQRLIDRVNSFKKEYSIYSYEEWLKTHGIQAMVKGEEQYPPLLTRSPNSPLVLFGKGKRVSWHHRPIVAVVGTRQMTAYGHLVTSKITRELSHLGALIVSGFMYGVDVTAHKSCIDAGGETVAVLGYGFEYCYPDSQRELMKELLEKGAYFVTPFAPHVSPKKGQFVARNRVVAGMSHAVVVTEAAEKSGSHITAGYAVDEGKVVCAVPGPITNPYSEGTRSLINQGAVLVQSGKEVLEECSYPPIIQAGTEDQTVPETGTNNPIIDALKSGAFSIEELMEVSKLQYTAVISILTKLELSGKVKKEGGRWNLIS